MVGGEWGKVALNCSTPTFPPEVSMTVMMACGWR